MPSWSYSRSAYDYGTRNGGFGDVNGDGWEDFLRYSTAAAWPDSEAVDLFLGGPEADSLPDLTLRYASYLGHRWKVVPDLNGDGRDDIFGSMGCREEGYPCVYFGGNPPDFDGDLQLFPGSSSPAYIWQSGVGDINADGYNDLALSGEDSGPGQYGEVAIYLGGRWMDGEPDIRLLGVLGGPYLHAGYRTVSAGDFNGDGIPDWVYSKRGNDARGVITVVSGDTTLHVSVPPGHGSVVPESMKLLPPYPNPFNPETTIRYDVKQAGHLRLTILNLLGQEVTRLVDKRHGPGSYTISWNAADLPSGIYLCRMEAQGFAMTRKVVLLK